MQHLINAIGLVAAALTSLSYIRQVQKAWPRGSTGDLSVRTLGALAAGLGMWTAYGVLKVDYVIILANAVGLSLVVTLPGFVWQDRLSSRRRPMPDGRRRPF